MSSKLSQEEIVQWTTNSDKIPDGHWLGRLPNQELLKGLKWCGVSVKNSTCRADLQELFLKAAKSNKQLQKALVRRGVNPTKLFELLEPRLSDEEPIDLAATSCIDLEVALEEEEQKQLEHQREVFNKNNITESVINLDNSNLFELIKVEAQKAIDNLGAVQRENISIDKAEEVNEAIAEQKDKIAEIVDTVKISIKTNEENFKVSNEINFIPVRASSPINEIRTIKQEKVQVNNMDPINISTLRIESMPTQPSPFYNEAQDDINEWLEKYETEAKGWRWSEKDKIDRINLAMKGEATIKYNEAAGEIEEPTTWNEMKEFLLKTFKKDPVTLKEDRKNLKFDEMNFTNYVNRFKKISYLLNPHLEEKKLVLKLIKSLPPDPRQFLLNRKITSLKVLKEEFEAWKDCKDAYGITKSVEEKLSSVVKGMEEAGSKVVASIQKSFEESVKKSKSRDEPKEHESRSRSRTRDDSRERSSKRDDSRERSRRRDDSRDRSRRRDDSRDRSRRRDDSRDRSRRRDDSRDRSRRRNDSRDRSRRRDDSRDRSRRRDDSRDRSRRRDDSRDRSRRRDDSRDRGRSSSRDRGYRSDKKAPICYKCGYYGHYQNQCRSKRDNRQKSVKKVESKNGQSSP